MTKDLIWTLFVNCVYYCHHFFPWYKIEKTESISQILSKFLYIEAQNSRMNDKRAKKINGEVEIDWVFERRQSNTPNPTVANK